MRRLAVVISAWDGHPPSLVARLVESTVQYDAGAPFDLVVMINGEAFDLPEEVERRAHDVIFRPNVGYNLGAWEAAWRTLPGHDGFLFLQDECTVLRDGWLRDFAQAFETRDSCGLVGENIRPSWCHPWDKLTASSGEMGRRACYYRNKLREWSVPEGADGSHVTSVVHFTSRDVLERVDGYRVGTTKAESIAAEIAFSRSVVSLGLRLEQVGKLRHSRIAHRQWSTENRFGRLRRKIWTGVRRMVLGR